MAVFSHKVEIRRLFSGLKVIRRVEPPHYFFISQLSFFLIFSYPVREYPDILQMKKTP